jgi:hypothetical protein
VKNLKFLNSLNSFTNKTKKERNCKGSPELRKVWESIVGKPMTVHSTICSSHFTKDAFTPGRKRLKSWAHPSLNLEDVSK